MSEAKPWRCAYCGGGHVGRTCQFELDVKAGEANEAFRREWLCDPGSAEGRVIGVDLGTEERQSQGGRESERLTGAAVERAVDSAENGRATIERLAREAKTWPTTEELLRR